MHGTWHCGAELSPDHVPPAAFSPLGCGGVGWFSLCGKPSGVSSVRAERVTGSLSAYVCQCVIERECVSGQPSETVTGVSVSPSVSETQWSVGRSLPREGARRCSCLAAHPPCDLEWPLPGLGLGFLKCTTGVGCDAGGGSRPSWAGRLCGMRLRGQLCLCPTTHGCSLRFRPSGLGGRVGAWAGFGAWDPSPPSGCCWCGLLLTALLSLLSLPPPL